MQVILITSAGLVKTCTSLRLCTAPRHSRATPQCGVKGRGSGRGGRHAREQRVVGAQVCGGLQQVRQVLVLQPLKGGLGSVGVDIHRSKNRAVFLANRCRDRTDGRRELLV